VLSDGTIVWVDEVAQTAEAEVARRDVAGRFADVLPSVVSLSEELAGVVDKIAPTKATVQFGITFRVEASGLALLVAKGGADANFVLTLEWERKVGPMGEVGQDIGHG
jgi:hypothetical protein